MMAFTVCMKLALERFTFNRLASLLLSYLYVTSVLDTYVVLVTCGVLGLWESCSNFSSLFYLEFLLKCYHYAFYFKIISHKSQPIVSRWMMEHKPIRSLSRSCYLILLLNFLLTD